MERTLCEGERTKRRKNDKTKKGGMKKKVYEGETIRKKEKKNRGRK